MIRLFQNDTAHELSMGLYKLNHVSFCRGWVVMLLYVKMAQASHSVLIYACFPHIWPYRGGSILGATNYNRWRGILNG